MAGGVGGRGSMCGGGHVWWWGGCGRGACVVGDMCGRGDGHCSGRYASHWNAFLFYPNSRDLGIKKMETNGTSLFFSK